MATSQLSWRSQAEDDRGLATLALDREAAKVNSLERKVSVHERSIGQLADAMCELLAVPAPPPKRPIGFVHHEDKGASKKTAGARSRK